jgi:sulfur dioxygenase
VSRRRAAPEVPAHTGAREGPRLGFAAGILTADALLVGSRGRTDPPNGNATRQYHTLYYILKSLPDGLLVCPGHDYEGRGYSTLGEEKESNPKMNFLSEEEFVGYMEKENTGTLTPVYQLAEALKANMA